MTLAEGVEARMLKEALTDAVSRLDFPCEAGQCSPFHYPPICKCGALDALAKFQTVLSRPKSSYEQEAGLMEAVVDAAEYVHVPGDPFAEHKIGRYALKKAVEALDEFRSKKPTPSTSQEQG